MDNSDNSPRRPLAPDQAGAFERPRWFRDVLRFLPLKPQFVLSGNVRDLQLMEAATGSVAAQPLPSVLAAELRTYGYETVLAYDPVDGFHVAASGGAKGAGDDLLAGLGLQHGAHGSAPAGLELFAATLGRLVNAPGPPIALVADFASRLLVRSDSPTAVEHAAFTRALVLSHQARARPHGTPPRPFINTVLGLSTRRATFPTGCWSEIPGSATCTSPATISACPAGRRSAALIQSPMVVSVVVSLWMARAEGFCRSRAFCTGPRRTRGDGLRRSVPWGAAGWGRRCNEALNSGL